MGGARYAIAFIDELSRYRHVYPMVAKSDTPAKLEEYLADFWTLLRGRSLQGVTGWLAGLRSDNGGEYVSEAVQAICRKEGIRQQLTAPYAPAQNGL